MAILGKNLNKNVGDVKTTYGNSRSYIKKKKYLVLIMQVCSYKG